MNFEEYVRQLEAKHNLTYNDIDQPWQTISDDSHELVFALKREDSPSSARPLIDSEEQTSQAPAVVPVTDKQEDSVAADESVVPVTETQEKQQQVTDAIAADDSAVSVTETQEKSLADTKDASEKVADDSSVTESSDPVTELGNPVMVVAKDDDATAAPVTETQEKSVSDTLTQDDILPVTETQEKTLANMEEGSGQSDSTNSTITEEEVVIFIHQDAEDNSTIDSAVTTEFWKVDVIEIVKVDEPVATQSNESVNEGSGNLALADSSNDEGSGVAEILINVFSDGLIGEGSAANETDEAENSTTILPETVNDDASTTDSPSILKGGLATEGNEESTTESASESAVIHTKDLDEKDVKSTESPIESTEVQVMI